MNGSAHSTPNVLYINLKRGPAGKFILLRFLLHYGSRVWPGGSVLVLRPAAARFGDTNRQNGTEQNSGPHWVLPRFWGRFLLCKRKFGPHHNLQHYGPTRNQIRVTFIRPFCTFKMALEALLGDGLGSDTLVGFWGMLTIIKLLYSVCVCDLCPSVWLGCSDAALFPRGLWSVIIIIVIL